jgi:hypothetical protein
MSLPSCGRGGNRVRLRPRDRGQAPLPPVRGITPAVLIAAGDMLAAHRATLDSGTDQLAAAEGEWLMGVRLVVTALAVTTSRERRIR